MNPPTGVTLFNLIEQYQNNPLAPRTLSDLKHLEEDARGYGFDQLADYIKSWRLYIEYQVKAEWNVPES